MSRILCFLVLSMLVTGCSSLRQQTVDCCPATQSSDGQPCDGQPCDGQLCDSGACEDCLPPKVVGKVFYHKHVDKIVTKGTAKKCANRDLKEFDEVGGELTKDFRDGYQQAYVDLALGRPACVPAVPPQKYWHAWHRSCAGREAVDQWYAGYRNGLDNGLNSGVSKFNRIVGNSDSCCVSAAYISPYADSNVPSGVQSLDGQRITERSGQEAATPQAAVAQEVPAAVPAAPPSEAWPATYGGVMPIQR